MVHTEDHNTERNPSHSLILCDTDKPIKLIVHPCGCLHITVYQRHSHHRNHHQTPSSIVKPISKFASIPEQISVLEYKSVVKRFNQSQAKLILLSQIMIVDVSLPRQGSESPCLSSLNSSSSSSSSKILPNCDCQFTSQNYIRPSIQ